VIRFNPYLIFQEVWEKGAFSVDQWSVLNIKKMLQQLLTGSEING